MTDRFEIDCHAAGVRYIALKGLRTSVITNLLMDRHNLKGVSMFVGHGDENTTLTHYAQFVPTEDTASAFEATLFETEDSRD